VNLTTNCSTPDQAAPAHPGKHVGNSLEGPAWRRHQHSKYPSELVQHGEVC